MGGQPQVRDPVFPNGNRQTGWESQTNGKVRYEESYDIVRTKRFPIKPMSVEEAILQMNLLGHTFFMFRNAHTNEINLVYKRKKGDYAVIEPDDDW